MELPKKDHGSDGFLLINGWFFLGGKSEHRKALDGFHGNIDGKSWQEPGQELLRPVGGREDGRPWAMGKAAQT